MKKTRNLSLIGLKNRIHPYLKKMCIVYLLMVVTRFKSLLASNSKLHKCNYEIAHDASNSYFFLVLALSSSASIYGQTAGVNEKPILGKATSALNNAANTLAEVASNISKTPISGKLDKAAVNAAAPIGPEGAAVNAAAPIGPEGAAVNAAAPIGPERAAVNAAAPIGPERAAVNAAAPIGPEGIVPGNMTAPIGPEGIVPGNMTAPIGPEGIVPGNMTGSFIPSNGIINSATNEKKTNY
jgi:hypothetical protein